MKNKLGKKGKILVGVLTPVAALVTAFAILCFVTMGMYSPAFLGRVLTHWDSDVKDYKIFPERIIRKSVQPYAYEKNPIGALENISVNGKTLNKFVDGTDTTSFIIVKDDKVVYERYAGGYDANSVNTSFSMAKSVVSLLIGKAIENGNIKSVEEPISAYITEFKNKKIG